MLALVAGVGLLVGVVMGALGGGGAVLTVPALVYFFGMAPARATTASLVVVGVSSLTSALPPARRGLVDLRTAAAFVLCGLLGSAAGSRLSHLVDGDVLMACFGVLLLAIATIMIRRARPGSRSGGAGDGRPAADGGYRWGPLVAAATGVSLLTGFFGVGGGFAIVPALTLLLGVPMRVAVGTSLLVIAGNAVTALAWRAGTLAELDWTVTLTMTAAMVLGGWVGGRVGRRTSPARLQQAFAVLLVAVGVATLVETLV